MNEPINANALDTAGNILLAPAGLTDQQISVVLGHMLGTTIDHADLYFQMVRRESWLLEQGIVKEGAHSMERGVGARAISGEKTGFAYADEVALPAIQQAAKAARSIARRGQQGTVQAWQRPAGQALYRAVDPLDSLRKQDKIELLQTIDARARAQDPRVKQVIASLSGQYEVILVAASDGVLAADIRPLVRLNVSVVVESEGRREQASSGGGGRVDYAYFDASRVAEYADEAVRQALVALSADHAPAGSMPVVLGPGWPGVLLHEAIGHGLEGDFNRKGTSSFTGRLGERVASSACTVVDDGTLAQCRGSLSIDDEGTPTQTTPLIEEGVLKNYMQDKHNAHLMGSRSTGNGRRESYRYLPLPRMTNTYMLPGKHDPAEIIASVDRGLYAVNFGGGQVDITSGKFVFSANEAYLIEQGKVTRPVKGATLIGHGPEVLTKVSMVGNDLQLDSGVGVCGKDGQSVPVGVGQPTLRVDALTVGGST